MHTSRLLIPALLLFASPAASPQQHDPSSADHSAHDAAAAPQSAMQDHSMMPDMMGMDHMQGALGPYPMAREASGTSWQPDISEHMGSTRRMGDWTLMGHVMLNGVYDWQDGPRGDEKAFLAGMFMGTARRDVGERGMLNLRAMLSPDPFMGKSGYPLLLAAGETADGTTLLVDRQHPHDLFMELSASYSYRLSDTDSFFVYAGLPGEPAFGPPAFMHRMSAMDSPEAPITHHWFDSTHITFGVLTAGYSRDNWRIEASRFRGREPDQDRFDIEESRLDSTSVRVSWNPTERLALQASWADLNSPEQLEPNQDETRWSGSAIYTVPLGDKRWWSTTLAWGQKDHGDESLMGIALETAIRPIPMWTVFARAEQVDTEELGGTGVETVSKASIGALRDFDVMENVTFGVGALYSHNFVPDALEPSYGGDPDGAMAFVRLKIGG